MIHGKKGQYAKIMRRGAAIAARQRRLEKTYEKHFVNGETAEEIAVDLGVSAQTVKGYIKEVRSRHEKFELNYEQEREWMREKQKAKEDLKLFKDSLVYGYKKSFLWAALLSIAGWTFDFVVGLSLFLIVWAFLGLFPANNYRIKNKAERK